VIADALALLAANVCLLLAGAGVLRLLGGWREIRHLPRRLGLSYMCGVAAVGLIAQLLYMAGLSLVLWQILLLCAALSVAGLLGRGPEPRPALAVPDRERPVLTLAVGIGAAFLVLAAVDFWFQPLSAWDAWQQWTAKAQSLVLLDGLDPDVFAAAPYVAWNPDYPILLPALEAIDFRFMGGFNTQIIHLQFWLLLVGFFAALAELLRDRVRPLVLWPLLLSLLLAPALVVHAGSAQADMPLGGFVGLAAVCAWAWVDRAEPWALALLALFSAAALATKLDGLIYIGALFLVLVPVAARSSLRRGGATVAAGVVALLGIVPWRAWVALHDVSGYYTAENVDTGFLLSEVKRVPLALRALLEQALDPGSWILVVPLGFAAAIVGFVAGRASSAILLAGTASLSVVGFAVVYWLTPLPFYFHLGTSASRIVVPLVFLCGALAPAVLNEALDARRERPLAPG
jgi:hypothetical protein